MIPLVMSVVAGAMLGTIFFGLLWWTVRSLATSRRPALLAGISYPIRLAVLAVGLWTIAAGDWQRLIAALVGLLLARSIIVRVTAPVPHHHRPIAPRTGDD